MESPIQINLQRFSSENHAYNEHLDRQTDTKSPLDKDNDVQNFQKLDLTDDESSESVDSLPAIGLKSFSCISNIPDFEDDSTNIESPGTSSHGQNGEPNWTKFAGGISPAIRFKNMIVDKETFSEGTNSGANSPLKRSKPSSWKKVSLMVRAASKLLQPEVVPIDDAKKLTQELYDCNRPQKSNESEFSRGITIKADKVENDAIANFQDTVYFFTALEKGREKDLEFLRKALLDDPKRFMFEDESPERLANKVNYLGQSPLYVACKNGNLKVIKLLIELKANPYQICNIQQGGAESILAVAVRWSHVDTVKYLISEEFKWDYKELKVAYAQSNNQLIKQMLKKEMGRVKPSVFGKLFK